MLDKDELRRLEQNFMRMLSDYTVLSLPVCQDQEEMC